MTLCNGTRHFSTSAVWLSSFFLCFPRTCCFFCLLLFLLSSEPHTREREGEEKRKQERKKEKAARSKNTQNTRKKNKKMEVFNIYITQQLPQYLSSLPIPETLDGYFELSGEEWLQIAPLFSLIFSLILLISIQFFVGAPSSAVLNTEGHEAKEVRKLQKKTAFCRCWQSKKVGTMCQCLCLRLCLCLHASLSVGEQPMPSPLPAFFVLTFLFPIFFSFVYIQFPLCDGSHHAHNKKTGDSLGPIVVE